MRADDPRLKQLHLPPPAPPEYAGQWVAWNEGRSEIVAHGSELAQVENEARASGCDDPIFEKVLPSNAYFVGGA